MIANLNEQLPDELVDAVMAYEAGTLDDDGIIKLFQKLIDKNLVQQFQGKYTRIAKQLVTIGVCKVKGTKDEASLNSIAVFG